jgi:hypothetical protein
MLAMSREGSAGDILERSQCGSLIDALCIKIQLKKVLKQKAGSEVVVFSECGAHFSMSIFEGWRGGMTYLCPYVFSTNTSVVFELLKLILMKGKEIEPGCIW